MLNIADGQRVTVWSVEDKGNYSLVKMGSSRKDKRSGEYANSNWSFVRFVGSAHEKAKELKEKDRILLKGAGISQEPYVVDGEKKWPKNPQIVVFNFVWQEKEDSNSSSNRMDEPPVMEEEGNLDEMPF